MSINLHLSPFSLSVVLKIANVTFLLFLEHTSIRLLPTTNELPHLLSTLQDQLTQIEASLAPHRASKSAPPSDEEVAKLDQDWTRWRDEWKKRKTMFKGYVYSVISRCFLSPHHFQITRLVRSSFGHAAVLPLFAHPPTYTCILDSFRLLNNTLLCSISESTL